MKYTTILLLMLAHGLWAQDFKERELNSSIKEVTIYLQGALVSRTGKLEVQPGKSILRMKSLSPYIDEKSVQVKGVGDLTILSVNHKLNHLDRLKRDQRIDSLNQVIKSLNFKLSTSQSRLDILREKQSLLAENKNLRSDATGVSVAQLKQTIDFYDRELSSIKAEELDIRMKMEEMNETKTQIQKEIADARKKDDLPTGEIEIRVEATAKTNAEFVITYLVANAGWYPKYDIRVNNVDQPLNLTYKADVYQNTGIDWSNVKLRLSNGDPNQSGVAPELQTWFLNYARNTYYTPMNYQTGIGNVRAVSGRILDDTGEPLPGVNVIVKGTTVGTTTDIDGNYSLTLPNGASTLVVSFIGFATKELPITSPTMNTRMEMDVEQLEEVVATGYSRLQGKVAGIQIRGVSSIKSEASPLTSTTIENQTTIEFEVDKPYSIKSNGEKLSVDLNRYEIETIYEYYAVPKLDKDAFLIARIINWDQYNLLEGEANLYFEDKYVGRSVLDAKSLEDTLDISLGRDKSIVIGRKKIDEYSETKTIGLNRVESRGFEIIARNKKSEPIKLTLFDQLPVPLINDITVTPSELSNATYNDKTGEVMWELLIKPQQQVELKLGYEVKYPKNEKVILE